MGNPFGETDNNSSLDIGADVGQNGDQAQGTGYNPNFQPLLSEVPQDLHPKIIPHLQQWDRGVNDRFQKLQSDYAPWKPILSSGVTPDMAQNGLNILSLLERDPEALYRVLVDSYGFGKQEEESPSDQGQQQQQQQQLDPRYDQLSKNFEVLAEHVLKGARQEQEAAADRALAVEFDQAHKKLGEFDDMWARAYCIANPEASVERAGKAYQEWYAQIAAKHGARPLISGGSSGGVPGLGSQDPSKLSGKDTRSLVADMLRQAKAQNY